MLPDLPSRQAASYVDPGVGWGVHLHQSMSGVFFSLIRVLWFWMYWSLSLVLPLILFCL